MSPLPPFVAKLIDSDDYEEKKYFETKAAAEKWVLGEGKDKFDGDVQRAEIHHESDGLIWSKDRLKIEDDIRYKQMRNPGSLLWQTGMPRPKPKPEIKGYCSTCLKETMFWAESEPKHGFLFGHKRIFRCSECYQVMPDVGRP
jgi:hypothetical protein